MSVALKIEVMPHAWELPLPAYQTAGAAGMDLIAAVPEYEPIKIAPGDFNLVPTGLRMAIPQGYEVQVRPRSGLAAKWGVTVLNAPGTIDSDYRGEIHVILINHGKDQFVVRRGDRIAQMVVAKVETATIALAKELEKTGRGAGGFGSTGQ